MKLFQAVQTIAQVLLLSMGTGAATVGVLQLAPKGCAGPAHKLPAS
jgi:hypothetical protein